MHHVDVVPNPVSTIYNNQVVLKRETWDIMWCWVLAIKQNEVWHTELAKSLKLPCSFNYLWWCPYCVYMLTLWFVYTCECILNNIVQLKTSERVRWRVGFHLAKWMNLLSIVQDWIKTKWKQCFRLCINLPLGVSGVFFSWY